ncbi:MAG TPA: hypothetical protein VLK84_18220 [Longimicrobium sp.]|nr:hypothetical protein [Longimicrobium sp.]
MKIGYLGDSYDIVKRFLLQSLGAFGCWSAHPMFTEAVSPADVAAFERMIGVPVVSDEVLERRTDRGRYFASASGAGHLFLDPNTGLRMGRGGKNAPSYLFGEDLLRLVRARPGSLTMVFDQSLGRGAAKEDLERKLAALEEEGVAAFAYHSHACFVIATGDAALANEARGLLQDAGLPEGRLLGP